MADETPSNAGRRGARTGDTNGNNPTISAYNEWSTERLVDCYRRNSILLREYGSDERTIRVLCAVEEHLRARTIDPNRIIEGIEAADT